MLGDPETGEAAEGMGLYWRIEKQIRALEGASGSVVGATGALYAVRRELLTALPAGTILDDVYIPMHVVKQRKRVVFERRARVWDSPNGVGRREFYRKVRTLGGNYQLLQLAPWLLSGKNPLWFEFVSHKLLRLLVPFAMVGLLVSSAVLEGPFYRVCLWAQAGFYALSLLALAQVRLRAQRCALLSRSGSPSAASSALRAASRSRTARSRLSRSLASCSPPDASGASAASASMRMTPGRGQGLPGARQWRVPRIATGSSGRLARTAAANAPI